MYNGHFKDHLLLQSPKTVAFIPALCYVVGLKESIILQQIHYLVFNSEGKNRFDDEDWFYCTYEQLHLMLPFESPSSIDRTVRKLVTQELLIVDNFNRINRIKKSSKFYDQIRWYRFNYEMLEYTIERKLEGILPATIEKLTTNQKELEHIIEVTSTYMKNIQSNHSSNTPISAELFEMWDGKPFHWFTNEYPGLIKLIKRQLKLISNIMEDRNTDSSELWNLNKVKSLTYNQEINEIIEEWIVCSFFT